MITHELNLYNIYMHTSTYVLYADAAYTIVTSMLQACVPGCGPDVRAPTHQKRGRGDGGRES